LSRCNSKLFITSSRDMPGGLPAGLNRQPQFGTTQNPENAVVQPTPVSVSRLPSSLRPPHLTAWLAPTITIAA
jgi:hypothetical protein